MVGHPDTILPNSLTIKAFVGASRWISSQARIRLRLTNAIQLRELTREMSNFTQRGSHYFVQAQKSRQLLPIPLSVQCEAVIQS